MGSLENLLGGDSVLRESEPVANERIASRKLIRFEKNQGLSQGSHMNSHKKSLVQSSPSQSKQIQSMQCPDVRRLLGEFVEASLPRHLHQSVNGHLCQCAPCRSFKSSYMSVVNTAKTLPEKKLSDGARDRLHTALNQRLGLNLPNKK